MYSCFPMNCKRYMTCPKLVKTKILTVTDNFNLLKLGRSLKLLAQS